MVSDLTFIYIPFSHIPIRFTKTETVFIWMTLRSTISDSMIEKAGNSFYIPICFKYLLAGKKIYPNIFYKVGNSFCIPDILNKAGNSFYIPDMFDKARSLFHNPICLTKLENSFYIPISLS